MSTAVKYVLYCFQILLGVIQFISCCSVCHKVCQWNTVLNSLWVVLVQWSTVLNSLWVVLVLLMIRAV